MTKCAECPKSFEVSDIELELIEKLSPTFDGNQYLIPAPKSCPTCRLQRRFTFRNQIYAFLRPSSLSGKNVFSSFPATSPFPVYSIEEWWGDAWDDLATGRPYNPSQSVFAQLQELQEVSPHLATSTAASENCDYCAGIGDCKNCYLIFNSNNAVDCMYGEQMWGSKDSVDCSYARESELCFDCVMCINCYSLQSSLHCENCRDSQFLLNCIGCDNCLGCVNLRHQRFQIFNQQYSETEYRRRVAEYKLGTFSGRTAFQALAQEHFHKHPQPHAAHAHVENVSGNHLVSCRDVHESFLIRTGENLLYCSNLDGGAKDCIDHSFIGINSELIYQAVHCGLNIRNLAFCYWCVAGSENLYYCLHCWGCIDCFLCVGLRKRRYCIFNKQYTKEEYEKTVSSIIQDMQARGEWGQFFPASLSPFPYNITYAQRHFPLSRSEIEARGLRWEERPAQTSQDAIPVSQLPDGLPPTDAAFSVLSSSGRAFRITSEEIKRYRTLGIPLPREPYDIRMNERAKRLGSFSLNDRICERSGKKLRTTFASDDPEIIWDREVYEHEFSG